MVNFFFLVNSLPTPLRYSVMRYVPCWGITSETLTRQKRYMRANYYLHKIIWMDTAERRLIRQHMKTFDFYHHTLYEFENDALYISIESEKKPIRTYYPTWDYVVVYYG